MLEMLAATADFRRERRLRAILINDYLKPALGRFFPKQAIVVADKPNSAGGDMDPRRSEPGPA
jgi:hypothetical protein